MAAQEYYHSNRWDGTVPEVARSALRAMRSTSRPSFLNALRTKCDSILLAPICAWPQAMTGPRSALFSHDRAVSRFFRRHRAASGDYLECVQQQRLWRVAPPCHGTAPASFMCASTCVPRGTRDPWCLGHCSPRRTCAEDVQAYVLSEGCSSLCMWRMPAQTRLWLTYCERSLSRVWY